MDSLYDFDNSFLSVVSMSKAISYLSTHCEGIHQTMIHLSYWHVKWEIPNIYSSRSPLPLNISKGIKRKQLLAGKKSVFHLSLHLTRVEDYFIPVTCSISFPATFFGQVSIASSFVIKSLLLVYYI